MIDDTKSSVMSSLKEGSVVDIVPVPLQEFNPDCVFFYLVSTSLPFFDLCCGFRFQKAELVLHVRAFDLDATM